MMLRSTRGLGAARALANSGLGARRAGALRSTFGAPLSPMMTAESAEPDMVWRQGYYETLAGNLPHPVTCTCMPVESLNSLISHPISKTGGDLRLVG